MKKIIPIILIFGFANLGFCEDLDESFFYGKWRYELKAFINTQQHRALYGPLADARRALGLDTPPVEILEGNPPSDIYEFRKGHLGSYSSEDPEPIIWKYSVKEKERILHITFVDGGSRSESVLIVNENAFLGIDATQPIFIHIYLWKRVTEK